MSDVHPPWMCGIAWRDGWRDLVAGVRSGQNLARNPVRLRSDALKVYIYATYKALGGSATAEQRDRGL